VTAFYDYPIAVPFGRREYDAALGGSHNQTYACPPNTEIRSIVDQASITEISSPSWGKQITMKMKQPLHGHAYFSMQHFAAIHPSLHVGQMIRYDTLLGWSGGGTHPSDYGASSNPTGQNFCDSPAMSSQMQIGIALCDGPGYGYSGWSDWSNGKPMDVSLDPSPLVSAYRTRAVATSTSAQKIQFEHQWRSVVADGDPETGIAGIAFSMYLEGRDPGPPLTPELANTDWHGVEHLYQVFPSGMIYWYSDGHHEWHAFA
jgi:hypothetical protein